MPGWVRVPMMLRSVVSDGVIPDLGSTDLELVTDGSNVQLVGMRFGGVAIPTGASIVSAHIEFEVDETTSETTNLTISGEDVDDAVTFTDANGNISSRTQTSAEVAWDSRCLEHGE